MAESDFIAQPDVSGNNMNTAETFRQGAIAAMGAMRHIQENSDSLDPDVSAAELIANWED